MQTIKIGNKNFVCKICQSKRASVFLKTQDHVMLKCKKCGFIFMPSISKDYNKNTVEHYKKKDPFMKVAKSRESLYQRFLARTDKKLAKKKRILDIGCGVGFFLSLARQRGWDCYGVEAVSSLCKKAREKGHLNNITNSTFEDIKFSNHYFNVITFWNVLEEIEGFEEIIVKAKRMLGKNGLLFIRTPNAVFHSFFYYLFCFKLMPREVFIFHIRNFSKKSILILLKRVGFSNIKVRNSHPTTGDPYSVGRKAKIFKIFVSFLAQLLFILSFGKLTIASSIEIFAENV